MFFERKFLLLLTLWVGKGVGEEDKRLLSAIEGVVKDEQGESIGVLPKGPQKSDADECRFSRLIN